MPLPEAFLQELKMRSDIVDVVSSYVSLRRSGRNMVGLCPFHHEKTPSFNVYAENGSFYCFGCGVGGDVITFIRRIENLDYMEAVRFSHSAPACRCRRTAWTMGWQSCARGSWKSIARRRGSIIPC